MAEEGVEVSADRVDEEGEDDDDEEADGQDGAGDEA